jgi:hypothetical protein
MRSLATLLLCLVTGACASVSSLPPPDAQAPPDENQLNAGIATGITDSHFAPPIEVTDAISAPASSTQPWMVCIRSGASEETRRLTYSLFYGRTAEGKDGVYAKSRYSVYADGCATQTYHLHGGAASTPPPAASPSPPAPPKKHGKHHQ